MLVLRQGRRGKLTGKMTRVKAEVVNLMPYSPRILPMDDEADFRKPP